MNNTLTHPCLMLALLLVACDRQQPTELPTHSNANPPTALEAVFLNAPPQNAEAIHSARTDAQPGDQLVLRGRVMGATEPFVSGRAAFVLGDPEILTACSDRSGDECSTPWDTCCDSPQDRRIGTATIQVLGVDGRVIPFSIEGIGGLKKLTRLVVQGSVAEGVGPETLVLNATGVYVEP